MFYFEKCYDIPELLRNNMHIHSHYSHCARPEMKLADIVREAERCGLENIAITDHSDIALHNTTVRNNEALKAERDALTTRVHVRIGAEISLYGVGKYSQKPEEIRAMEYRLFAQNHYHVNHWEHPEEQTPQGYARHTQKCLEGLFATGMADCIAHPIVPIKGNRLADPAQMLDCFSDETLGDLLEKGERAGCAWELHRGAVAAFPEFSRRYFQIGREVGVHFTYAADAHRLVDIDPAPAEELFRRVLLAP